MEARRLGLAVWVRNIKAARNLRKFGNVHYISRRMQYVAMYVDAKNIEHTIERIRKLNFVTRVEPSYRHEIPIEYGNARGDNTKEKEKENQATGDIVQEDHPVAAAEITDVSAVLESK